MHFLLTSLIITKNKTNLTRVSFLQKSMKKYFFTLNLLFLSVLNINNGKRNVINAYNSEKVKFTLLNRPMDHEDINF